MTTALKLGHGFCRRHVFVIVKAKHHYFCPVREGVFNLAKELVFKEHLPCFDVICFHEVDLAVYEHCVGPEAKNGCKCMRGALLDDFRPATVYGHFGPFLMNWFSLGEIIKKRSRGGQLQGS